MPATTSCSWVTLCDMLLLIACLARDILNQARTLVWQRGHSKCLPSSAKSLHTVSSKILEPMYQRALLTQRQIHLSLERIDADWQIASWMRRESPPREGAATDARRREGAAEPACPNHAIAGRNEFVGQGLPPFWCPWGIRCRPRRASSSRVGKVPSLATHGRRGDG